MSGHEHSTPRADKIASLMRELFGATTSPQVVPPLEVTNEVASADATVVISKPRRFARGTESEATLQENDQPTRGRRSSPRIRAHATAEPHPGESITFVCGFAPSAA